MFWCSRCKRDHAGECGSTVSRKGTAEVLDWTRYFPAAELPYVTDPPEWQVGDIMVSALPLVNYGDKIVFKVVGPKTSQDSYPVEILAALGPWMSNTGRQIGSRLNMGRTSLFGHHSKKVA